MKSPLERIDNKISQLEREKKILERSLKMSVRKERTRRLIQIGALSEKYFDLYHLDLKEIEEVYFQFADFVKSNRLEKHKK
ncbi:hypothetical protein [Heyndrickxia camelliae]|uniref:Uncharacterized protein n=1 Tax=Heyndrickxia camelliae TaxID=1707093 RepID=A0A2N3LEW6_9BACI|nr:hypothetical protein [Heyndrickxia camelliae]PKR83073.1 hypothetical protein CWO92_21285 [Heyndrickxia camelliae]